MIQVRLRQVNGQGDQAVDVDAFLDSGAETSLFDGAFLEVIGLNLLSGRPRSFISTMGPTHEGRMHRVRLEHEQLGNFDLEIGFSTGPISRNLLGRDFFDFLEVGFREHQESFLIEVRAQPVTPSQVAPP